MNDDQGQEVYELVANIQKATGESYKSFVEALDGCENPILILEILAEYNMYIATLNMQIMQTIGDATQVIGEGDYH